MEKIKITNSIEPLTANFRAVEFWAPKFRGRIDFEIPKCLVEGAQIIRDFFGPTLITSTIRPKDKFGYHQSGNAIDLLPLEETLVNIKKFENECRLYQSSKNSELIIKLREVGVEGFLIESSNCIHLDFRNQVNCASTDKFGKYIVCEWHNDGSKFGKSNVIY